jgi:hypothetical protein
MKSRPRRKSFFDPHMSSFLRQDVSFARLEKCLRDRSGCPKPNYDGISRCLSFPKGYTITTPCGGPRACFIKSLIPEEHAASSASKILNVRRACPSGPRAPSQNFQHTSLCSGIAFCAQNILTPFKWSVCRAFQLPIIDFQQLCLR